MARFFIKPSEIGSKVVKFDANQARKIRKVLRMKVGDVVKVFDGSGWEYEVKLAKLTLDHASGEIIGKQLHERNSNITLVQALPKNLKIEFVLQKCTELGVDRMIFFESDHSQIDATRISKEKVQRWRSVVAGACEQSGRVFVPEVELWTNSVAELTERLKLEGSTILVLSPEGDSVNHLEGADFKYITFFVGPEGGFSSKEKSMFKENKFLPVKVASNILRSETAGMAFLAQTGLMRL